VFSYQGDTTGEQQANALVQRAARFRTDVFPVLTAAGLDVTELQLAWDFTTASIASQVSPSLHIGCTQ